MNYEKRWKALSFIFMIMLAFSLVFQGIPPIFGFIIPALGISHVQAGALMSAFGLPGIFISIPGGILTDVYGARRVGTWALTVTLMGSLIVALGADFNLLVLGRIISGIGALTISIVAPQTLSHWFKHGDLGKAMGIFNMAMPLGAILALNAFALVANASGWRVPLLLTSAYCLLALVLFYYKYPNLPGEGKMLRESPLSFQDSLSRMKGTGLPIWLIASIWMTYNASTISYLTFGGDYYTSIGYDPGYAGFLTSMLMIGALILSPVVGSLTDKLGKEEYFIAGGSIVLALALFLVPRVEQNPLSLGILIGISAALTPAPVFSLVPRFLPPEQMGLGYGILSTCLNFGVFIGPLMVGLLYDMTSNYMWGFNAMAIFSLLTAGISIYLYFDSSDKT